MLSPLGKMSSSFALSSLAEEMYFYSKIIHSYEGILL